MSTTTAHSDLLWHLARRASRLASVALAVTGTWLLWYLAIPRYTICPAIYPPTAGCAGDSRIVPAIVWTVLMAASLAAALALGRARGWRVLIGPPLVFVVCVAGYQATHFMRPFLVL